MRFVLYILLLLVLPGSARDRSPVKISNTEPTGAASDIPALAAILERGQWTPTPELSGRYEVGTIIDTSKGDHRIVAKSCFKKPPVVAPYIAAEVVGSLQAGVQVNMGMGGASSSGEIVKKVKFGTPSSASLEALYMKLSDECLRLFREKDPEALASMYVVQEVLKADIAEQTCGRIDAKGNFLGLGAADIEYSQACSQMSLEPVAVGYRTSPLEQVLPEDLRIKVQAAVGNAALQAASPVAPPPRMPTTSTKADTNEVVVDDSSHTANGRHEGLFFGTMNGGRLQWRYKDGRRGIGLRLEGGLALYSGYSPYPGFDLSLELEGRRDADATLGWLISLGGGFPGYVLGGANLVIDPRSAFRAELGINVGYPVVVPRITFGWLW